MSTRVLYVCVYETERHTLNEPVMHAWYMTTDMGEHASENGATLPSNPCLHQLGCHQTTVLREALAFAVCRLGTILAHMRAPERKKAVVTQMYSARD